MDLFSPHFRDLPYSVRRETPRTRHQVCGHLPREAHQAHRQGPGTGKGTSQGENCWRSKKNLHRPRPARSDTCTLHHRAMHLPAPLMQTQLMRSLNASLSAPYTRQEGRRWMGKIESLCHRYAASKNGYKERKGCKKWQYRTICVQFSSIC